MINSIMSAIFSFQHFQRIVVDAFHAGYIDSITKNEYSQWHIRTMKTVISITSTTQPFIHLPQPL